MLIEITYTESDLNISTNDTAYKVEVELFPHLGWMRFLNSFILLGRGSILDPIDEIARALANFVLDFPAPHSLVRFWVDAFRFGRNMSDEDMTGPSVTSLMTNAEDDLELAHDRFRHLEHFSGSRFRRFEHLRNLKFIRGNCFNQLDALVNIFLLYVI